MFKGAYYIYEQCAKDNDIVHSGTGVLHTKSESLDRILWFALSVFRSADLIGDD